MRRAKIFFRCIHPTNLSSFIKKSIGIAMHEIRWHMGGISIRTVRSLNNMRSCSTTCRALPCNRMARMRIANTFLSEGATKIAISHLPACIPRTSITAAASACLRTVSTVTSVWGVNCSTCALNVSHATTVSIVKIHSIVRIRFSSTTAVTAVIASVVKISGIRSITSIICQSPQNSLKRKRNGFFPGI